MVVALACVAVCAARPSSVDLNVTSFIPCSLWPGYISECRLERYESTG